ncbi:hypothetical protein [Sodalis sp. RH22]|uniref:hypothetical protein n=1 Tax=unclassified Sodalis (in: enterobacteria) TaxID=2636512 RepID=UPI0039B4E0BD
MNKEFVTAFAMVVFTVGGIAIAWKPVFSFLASLVASNVANKDMLGAYKEQVTLLRESNNLLKQENAELLKTNEMQSREISTLKTDLRIIKSALSILLAITESEGNDKFRDEVKRVMATLEEH